MIANPNGTPPERQRHKQGWQPTVFDRGSAGGRCNNCRHVDEFNNNWTCEAGDNTASGVDFSTRPGATCDWFQS
ncbi:hypothetical protein [Propionivibrio sp.]|uniref:hypothetical protein n=1 Tax=Propionivibrio sp. TaxID=2212460 RepID=UPI003BF04B5F